MRKKTAQKILISLAAIFAASTAAVAPAHANPKYASIVVDTKRDNVIRSRYADKKLYPASLTKMMTMMLIFDALERGDITLETEFTITQNAADQRPSKLGVKAGEKITVEKAIQALSVKSANDVAVVVAENLSDSVSGFSEMMNAKAAELGMDNTVYTNPNGLPDRRMTTTARDQARLLETLWEEYQDYIHFLALKSFTYNGKTYKSFNKLIMDDHALAGKTGYTYRSGFQIAVVMGREDEEFVTVVMGGRKAHTRDRHALVIFDEAFNLNEGARLEDLAKRVGVPRLKPTEEERRQEQVPEWYYETNELNLDE